MRLLGRRWLDHERAAVLEGYMLGDARQEVEAFPGLISHEVYRIGEEGGRILAVHNWRAIEDLEQIRAAAGDRVGAGLRELQATMERLTGVVAMQFSRLEA